MSHREPSSAAGPWMRLMEASGTAPTLRSGASYSATPLFGSVRIATGLGLEKGPLHKYVSPECVLIYLLEIGNGTLRTT